MCVVEVPWRMSGEDPKVDGERCEITHREQPQKESVQSEWSRPVPRIAKKDLETRGCTSGCVSKDGGISEARTSSRGHSRVNEFVEKAMIASDAKTARMERRR